MKCVVCESPVLDRRLVEEEIKSGDDIVLLSLETLVCSNCGERYYDRRTLRRIEEARHKLGRQELEVEVIGKVYRAKAA